MSGEVVGRGRYTVERQLGRGGMASVYLARDRELERLVAIKILAGHLVSDPVFYERFVREARMAARLSHPNIVQIYDAGEENDSPYIVMEYVPGWTFADELRDRARLDPARAVGLAIQVCAGLDRAHSAGLVHRDVKPQNLLVRDDGVVKITDFGIARAAEATNLTEVGSVLGTAAYLAPEQAEGVLVTAAADIYSLGVVLYELLTARTPYAFGSLAELVVKQREEPIAAIRDLQPDVPKSVDDVVLRCLARDPESRPLSAAGLARDLAAACPGTTTVSLPSPSGVARATAVEAAPSTVQTRPLEAPTPPRRTHSSRPGRPRAVAAWAIVAAVAIGAALAIGALAGVGADGGGGSKRATVTPVPQVADPGEQARNLARWIRGYSAG